MNKEIKTYRLQVVEDNPEDYFLLQQYLQLSKLPIEKIFHADSIGVHSLTTLNSLLPAPGQGEAHWKFITPINRKTLRIIP